MRAMWVAVAVAACRKADDDEPADSELVEDTEDTEGVVDTDLLGDTAAVEDVPRFSEASPIDPAEIEEITRFRSGIGHDYADAFESCRSMKHYLCANGCETGVHEPSWTALQVRSPVAGRVIRVEPESFGSQVAIVPTGHDAWEIRLFHLADLTVVVDDVVTAGQILGHHASDDTLSDVAVAHFGTEGFQLVSFFDTLTADAFAAWQARGVVRRSDLQISRAARDAAPLTCDGERFVGADPLDPWVVLDPRGVRPATASPARDRLAR